MEVISDYEVNMHMAERPAVNFDYCLSAYWGVPISIRTQLRLGLLLEDDYLLHRVSHSQLLGNGQLLGQQGHDFLTVPVERAEAGTRQ